MGSISGTASTEIEASISVVYSVAADGEGATRWQQEIQAAECLARDAEGNQLTVRMETETPIKRLTSVLDYSYESPNRISWIQTDGDLKSVIGSWDLEELDTGVTRVTYALEVDPGRLLGMAIRGPVTDALRGKMVDSMPGKLKTYIENDLGV